MLRTTMAAIHSNAYGKESTSCWESTPWPWIWCRCACAPCACFAAPIFLMCFWQVIDSSPEAAVHVCANKGKSPQRLPWFFYWKEYLHEYLGSHPGPHQYPQPANANMPNVTSALNIDTFLHIKGETSVKVSTGPAQRKKGHTKCLSHCGVPLVKDNFK